MVWSVQIPNPLTVGGNGDIGEIDVLNADGTVAIALNSNGVIVYDNAVPIVEVGIFSPDGNLARPTVVVQQADGIASSKIYQYVNVQGIPTISFTIGSNGFASAGYIRARTWNAGNNDNLLEFAMSTQGGINNGIITIREKAAGGDTEIVVNKPIQAIDVNSANGADFNTETWHTLPLANGWVTNTNTPQYRMMPDGGVRLRGWMDTGTNADGTTVANLPVGYRPNQEQRFITGDLTTGHAFRYVEVKTSGAITVFNCAGASQLILDGIWFSVQI